MSSIAMEMSFEKTGPHERKLRVAIPAARVQEKVAKQLNEVASQVKIDGFRPGKVPKNLVQKRYGAQVRSEAIYNLLDEALKEALTKEKIMLASQPKIDIEKSGEDESLEFTATFEVYPEVVLKGLDSFPFKKDKVEIEEADIDEAIEKLRFRHATWEDSSEAAVNGMRVTFELTGALLEAPKDLFEENTEMAVRIGSAEAIPGFEDKLLGVKAGDSISFELDFPKNYFEQKLAGKPAKFDLKITRVQTAVLPTIDDAFFKQIRLDTNTVEGLRNHMRESLMKHAQEMISRNLKETIINHLLAEHATMDVPKSLVAQEMKALSHQHHDHEHGEHCDHDHDGEEGDREDALRRVRLSLLLGQFIRETEIKLDENKMYQKALEIAFSSPDPKGTLDNIYGNDGSRRMLASMVLEEQAIEKLIERVQETQEGLSYKGLLEKLKAAK